MNIGRIIKEARIKKGLTQSDVAIHLGFEYPQFVHLMENGRSKLPHSKIKPLCKLLGLDKNLIANILILKFSRDLYTEIK